MSEASQWHRLPTTKNRSYNDKHYNIYFDLLVDWLTPKTCYFYYSVVYVMYSLAEVAVFAAAFL